MEDIIDIIVTETTNLIEITSQPTDEIIDVNIIDNREDITLNVTPSLVEININSLTGNFGVNWGDIEGTLSDQTDLQDAIDLKADLVDGKVPSSQLPSYVDDIIEVATYSALPVIGETGKIYVVLDTNLIYRWSGSAYIEIKDSSAVWGAITGTLSSQTDLQSALNAKVPYTGATGNVNLGEYGATVGYLGFDTTPTSTPTGIGTMYWDSANRTVSLIDGDGDTTLQIGQEERVLVHNNTGSTLTDGQVVYVTGSTGELPSVALASNTTEATSSVTFGIVTESIAHGADGFVTTSGIVHGLNTLALTEGAALWLGSTAGTFTETKPVAPANSVLIGYVIKKSGGNGSIFVKIQNGNELEELHDVLITSVANNQGLFYESSSSLWKNKSIATVLGYTPANDANVVHLSGTETITGSKTFNSPIIIDKSSANTDAILFKVSGTQKGRFTINNTNGFDIFTSTDKSGYGVVFDSSDSNGILFYANNSSSPKFIVGDTFNNSQQDLYSTKFIKSGGTSAQFLKADGSVDTSVYALDSAVVHLTGNETITGLKYFFSGTKNDLLFVSETVGYASQTGYSHFKANTNHVEFINSTNTKSTKFIHGNGAYEFTMPNASGTIALTSNLSSYLPLSGGTLTGALSGTSATFSTTIADYAMSIYNVLDSSQGLLVRATDNDGDLYLLRLQSSNGATSQTWVDRFTVAKGGAATFSSSVTAQAIYATDATGSAILTTNGGGEGILSVNTANPLRVLINGGEKVRVTSAGNVGIGTTGSAWNAFTALDIGANASIANYTDYTFLGVNTYYSTSNNWTYKNNGYGAAILLRKDDGAIQFSNFANGTAGATASFTERMRITSGGELLVNTTSAGTDLTRISAPGASKNNLGLVSSDDTSGHGYIQFRNSSTTSIGSITRVGTTNAVAYNITSDYRLKEDLKSIKGLEILNKINVYDFKWKIDGSRMDGVIAHELQEILPYAVTGVKDGEQMQQVDYSKIVPVMVQAIKDLKAELDILKNK